MQPHDGILRQLGSNIVITLRRLTGIAPSSERLGRFPLWDIALMSCRQKLLSAQPERLKKIIITC